MLSTVAGQPSSRLVDRVLPAWRKPIQKSPHRNFERLEIVFDGSGDVAVVRVEVPVGEAVTHAGDVAPGVGRLGVEELCRNRLDGLSDLDEPDSDSIEDKAVGEPTACHVAPDGVDGIKDVPQPLAVAAAH